jgi:hypothetical protein
MKKLLLVSAIVLMATAARAQLTSEPAPGQISPGQTVLVDDGTCGPGKIKKVTGGSDFNPTTGQRIKGSSRKRACITKRN